MYTVVNTRYQKDNADFNPIERRHITSKHVRQRSDPWVHDVMACLIIACV